MLFKMRLSLSFPRSFNDLSHSSSLPNKFNQRREPSRAVEKKKVYMCNTRKEYILTAHLGHKERNAIVLITGKTARVRPNILPGEPFCRQSRQEAANKARARQKVP